MHPTHVVSIYLSVLNCSCQSFIARLLLLRAISKSLENKLHDDNLAEMNKFEISTS